MPDLSDIELATLALLPPDAYEGRLPGKGGFVLLGITPGGNLLRFGEEVPEDWAADITSLVQRVPPRFEEATRPALLGELIEIACRAAGAVSTDLGPHYRLDPGVQIDSAATIVRSDAPDAERVLAHNPGNWEADEWLDLVAGKLGPWAMALDGDRVVSISHTPGPMTDRAAEVGAWTDPDYRGRGLAAAATAAWSAIIAPSGRELFYSTSAHNLASQGVAAKLGARLIAWKWWITCSFHGPTPYRWAPHP